MMGELGLAVLTIQSQNGDIPDELSQALALSYSRYFLSYLIDF